MRKVLVVDDEHDLGVFLNDCLKTHGYDVRTAFSGQTAILVATEFKPELIILDLMLPDLDGISICEILRRLPATANVPILILTGWESSSAKALSLDAGADDYILKPFSVRTLMDRVSELLKTGRPALAVG